MMDVLVLNVILLIFNSGAANYQISRGNRPLAVLHLVCMLLNTMAIVAITMWPR